jgi:leucyl/phenylalanyl-tRNA--protein transferase
MIAILTPSSPFPPISQALPSGLLAVGGDLSLSRLKEAYSHAIFPWFLADQPILWWSPDPRAVLFLDRIRINRSLRKVLKKKLYNVTLNYAFEQVINACAEPRSGQPETWITDQMKAAYCQLHQAGMAHSIEIWLDKRLVGGLYGVDCGQIFAGESMFSRESNASKFALIYLAGYLRKRDYLLIDCQINNPFLETLGSCTLPRNQFFQLLEQGLKSPQKDWSPQVLI